MWGFSLWIIKYSTFELKVFSLCCCINTTTNTKQSSNKPGGVKLAGMDLSVLWQNFTERAWRSASQSSCWTLQTEPQSSQQGQYLEESPDRALFRTSGVSSGGTGTSGTPESALDSLSETPSFSTLTSLSEHWKRNTEDTEDSETRSGFVQTLHFLRFCFSVEEQSCSFV